MNASPPTPVMFGSVTLRTAAIAIEASTALPPRFNTSRPTIDANGWLLATMAWLARTTDRPAGTFENHWSDPLSARACLAEARAAFDASAGGAVTSAAAEAPAERSKNCRRLTFLTLAVISTLAAHTFSRLAGRAWTSNPDPPAGV